jgi:hypothetical protein
MELDEFKKYWTAAQQEDYKQQKHTTEAIDKIIMNATNTLGELKEKSIFWNRIGGWNSAIMIILVAVHIALLLYRGKEGQGLAGKLPLIGILVGFAWFSRWTYQRQEQIFSANTHQSLKAALSATILDFKRYYRFTNSIFLVISPLAFYAVFALLPGKPGMSWTAMVSLSCALTGFSFLIRFWYYKVVYFKRIKAMEANLRELENGQLS